MNQLTLNRPKENIFRLRSYSIVVDDEHVANLQNNSQQKVLLDSNEATIQAKIGWFGKGSHSKKLQLNEKNELKVNIQGNQFYNKGLVVFFLLLIAEVGSEYLLEGFQTTTSIIHLLTLIVAIYVIYTLTFGKHSWITISEV
ncbi:hypothetical protein CK503_09210 [Aliifodinibius salipaludis]|uniref:Uncharacterized protein n=1 Tax=Fodinibius salipaludis TaxID=2032627 RepID=A0A2A2GAK6_9BACT|nr:hypothetical protein [Aliifodinibius salipaludis]PAU93842.1 hypothetical protein CK503_09210 [Aliifodinibius salipaludis]